MKLVKIALTPPVIAISVALFAALGLRAAVPEGYTELKYIESTGTQWIDTEYTPGKNTRVVIRFQYTTSGAGTCFGFGASSSAASFRILRQKNADDATQCRYAFNVNDAYGNVRATDYATLDTDEHVADIGNAGMSFDGEPLEKTESGSLTKNVAGTAYLFAMRAQWVASPSADSFFTGRICSCQVYDGETLVRDFVPVLDANGKPCLLDVAQGHNKAYVNKATKGDDFTPGPVTSGITVKGHPSDYGEPSPGYGVKLDVEVGMDYTFTMPQGVCTNATKTEVYTCTGWTLVDNEGVGTSGSELTKTVNFAGGSYTLTWNWAVKRGHFGRTLNVPEEFATVRAAVDVAANGDVVRIAEGYCDLGSVVNVTNDIAIIGAGVDRTWLTNKVVSAAIVKLNNENATMSDFTFTNLFVNTLNQSLVVVTAGKMSDFKMTHCTDGNASNGKCFNINGAKAVVSHAVFELNAPWPSGGAHMLYMSAGTLENSLVWGTGRTGAGSSLSSSKGCSHGGGLYASGAVTVRNCSFLNNTATKQGGGLYLNSVSSGKTKFVNCVFAGNSAPTDTNAGAPEICYTAGTWNSTFSNCFENCAFGSGLGPIGEGGVNVTDADFKDLAGGDFRWSSASPAVDAGADYSPMAEKDLAGNPRVLDESIDIGCYEFAEGDVPGCSFTMSPLSGLVPLNVTTVAKVTGGKGKSLTYAWTVRNESMSEADILSDELAPSLTVQTPGWRTVTFQVYDGQTLFAEFARTNYLNVSARTNYVAAADATGVTPTYPYSTPETAYQGGLAEFVRNAVDGQTVLLGEGTFYLPQNGSLDLLNGVKVIGAGRGRTFLTRKAYAADYRFARLNHPDALLYGVCFTNLSNWVNDPGVWIDIKGGTISHCRMQDVQSGNGSSGAVTGSYSGKGVITHCELISCKTSGSGGTSLIWAQLGCVDNCLVRGGSVYKAGALNLKGAATVENCTFVGNSSIDRAGGAYIASSSGKIRNCVFAGNKAPKDASVGSPEYYVSSGSVAVFDRCAFGSGVTGVGTEPQTVTDDSFADWEHGDYHPASGSALVDNGIDSTTIPETDLDDQPRRPVGKGIDIGCYERPASKTVECNFTFEPTKGLVGSSFSALPTVDGGEGHDLSYRWTVTNDDFADDPPDVSEELEPTFTFAKAGHRTVRFEVLEDGVALTNSLRTAYVNVAVPTVFVAAADAAGVTPAYPYDTPETAAIDALNDRVDDSVEGQVIRLGDGAFNIVRKIALNEGVSIVGNGPDRTTVTNTTTALLFDLNHPNAVIRAFTIRAGGTWQTVPSNGDPSIVNLGVRGGTMADCCLSGCHSSNASSDRQVKLSSAESRVENCRFENCYLEGSGYRSVLDISAGEVRNSIFVGNSPMISAGTVTMTGGKLVNCTLAGNKASLNYLGQNSGFGGIMASGDQGAVKRLQVYNCIMVSNETKSATAPSGDWSISEVLRATCVSNCAFTAGRPTVGANPQTVTADDFRSYGKFDLRLRRGSPCVDAGQDVGWTEGDVDLRGERRKVGEHVDIGCYEFPWNGLMLLVR